MAEHRNASDIALMAFRAEVVVQVALLNMFHVRLVVNGADGVSGEAAQRHAQKLIIPVLLLVPELVSMDSVHMVKHSKLSLVTIKNVLQLLNDLLLQQ